MSKKIPFLEMFAALRQWTEFVSAMSGWKIVEAAIDRSSRSAVVTVEGAAGAVPNLIVQAEEAVGKCYGLNHVKLNCLADAPARPEPPQAAEPVQKPAAEREPDGPAPVPEEQRTPQDAFARAEAIRAAALKQVRQAAPSAKGKPGERGEKKGSSGKAIFGKPIKRAPVPIGELELDMGMVVIEGDVFAIENRELK